MEEERKKQLEREVFDLSQTAASLSSNIHDKRNELASLEAGKNAFLEKRDRKSVV